MTATHPDPLAVRLRDTVTSAERRWRTSLGVLGAITTPRIPTALLDELAAGLAPVLRELVADTVAEQLPEPPWQSLLPVARSGCPATIVDPSGVERCIRRGHPHHGEEPAAADVKPGTPRKAPRR